MWKIGSYIAFGLVTGIAIGRFSVSAFPSTPKGQMAASTNSPPPAQLQGSQTLSGKVAEVLQAGSYTYLRFETGEWAAVPAAPSLQAGVFTHVQVQQYMQNFQSPSLGRVFENVAFGTLGQQKEAPPTSESAQGVGGILSQLEKQAASGATVDVKVTPLPGATPVGEVYAKRYELNGRTVKVHGVVDRVNVVQGVAYIHLKDGTGSPAEKTDDLLCIGEKELPEGTVVTLEGTVGLDRDLGMAVRPVVLDKIKTL